MASEESNFNEYQEKALRDMAELRRFQGAAREFWTQYLACVGNLTSASKSVILLRQNGAAPNPGQAPSEPPAETPAGGADWRKIGEWVAGGGTSRLLVAYTSQLPQIAEECLERGSLVAPLEPVPVRGTGHFILAVRLVLSRDEGACIATCLLSEINEAAARESLMRLSLAADVPASYQLSLAGQQARTDVQKFAGALDLMAQVNEEKRFLAATLALCNGLATHYRCDRVSLGWLEGGYIRLRTISRTEKFDRQMAAAQALEKAMEECLDQDDEVVWPAPEGATVVARDHETFASEQKLGHVASFPLRVDDEPVAVLTCERLAGPFTLQELQEMRLSCDQASRRLSEMHHHDRWFGARWLATVKEQGAKLVGPQHTWAKIAGLLVSLLLAIFFFVRVDYRVEGNFVLKSDEVAFLTAPFDGYIETVNVRPGVRVGVGDTLLGLETADLELEESAALADLNRYQREAEKARAAENLAEMRIAESLAEQSRARLQLVQYRLEQARINSPFEGVVVEGDLRERLGAPVKQGDALFRVARLDALYVEAKIKEDDVHDILEGKTGEIAFVSQPKLKFPVRIEKVEPAAFPENEGNVFLVRCVPDGDTAAWWRPGMSGLCKLNVEKRTLAWIFTHRTIDFLRIFFWW